MADEVLLSQFLANLKAYKDSNQKSFLKDKAEANFNDGLDLIIKKLEEFITKKSFDSLSNFLRDTLDFLAQWKKENKQFCKKFCDDNIQLLEGIIPKLESVTVKDLEKWLSKGSIKPIVEKLIETRKVYDQMQEEINKSIFEKTYKPRIEKVKQFLQALKQQIEKEISILNLSIKLDPKEYKRLESLANEKNKYIKERVKLQSDPNADPEEIEDINLMIEGCSREEREEQMRIDGLVKEMYLPIAKLKIILEKLEPIFSNQLFQEASDENNENFYTNQIQYIKSFSTKNSKTANSLIAKIYNTLDETNEEYGNLKELINWLKKSDLKDSAKIFLDTWQQYSNIPDHYTRGAVIGLFAEKLPSDISSLIADKLNRQEGAKVSQVNKKSRDKAHEEENKFKPKPK